MSICRYGLVATTRQAAETPTLDHDSAAQIADFAVKWNTVAIVADDPI